MSKSESSVSRSWFVTLNNPADHGFPGEPSDVCHSIIDSWCGSDSSRSCAVSYCISVSGLHHCHIVLESIKSMRFSAVKNVFPSVHIEPTMGSKRQAEDYILKRGKFSESDEQVITSASFGNILGNQGKRTDLDLAQELLDDGCTPDDIFAHDIRFRRYTDIIRSHFFQLKLSDTPSVRPISVYWHCGVSGSGKSFTYVELLNKNPNNVYLLTDYSKGGFDKYSAERILFMDEFRGEIPYRDLLRYLDPYISQISCRYSNSFTLWYEVHIASIFPPELCYKQMVNFNTDYDSIDQLYRRINYFIYHYKSGTEYKKVQIPFNEYRGYDAFISSLDFIPASEKQQSIFH